MMGAWKVCADIPNPIMPTRRGPPPDPDPTLACVACSSPLPSMLYACVCACARYELTKRAADSTQKD